MRIIEKLRREATATAESRGHDLTRFSYLDGGQASAHCRRCKRSVWIDPTPAPNGIEISGEAIALNCITTTK